MEFSELDLDSAMWISPELEDAVAPRREAGRAFTPVTAGDADFATAADFGHHAGYLHRSFSCTPGADNTLYVSAHGLYEITINNKKITDAVLTSGPCNYYMKQPLDCYDVTPFLKNGENEITVVLGNGWYRGSCGPDGQKVLFGKDLALYLQLLADGRQVLVSDPTWEASTDGPIRGNDLEQGEICIAGKKPVYLRKAREVRLTKDLLYLSDARPVRRHETFPGNFLTTPDGSTVIDFGQVLAGVVDISLKGAPEGGRLALVCGEALDREGNFTRQNFEPGRRHFEGGIRQEERLVTAEGDCTYSPSFTILGFRYAKVIADFPVTPENASFTAVAIYSDMAETASFSSSSPELNRLFQNCLWSQKGAFCGIPLTNPTGGRAGETGPAATFTHTGLRLMDSGPVYEKWLSECEAGQHRNGRIPVTCPPVKGFSPRQYRCSQSAAWGDAVILVPWEMYAYTGDADILRRHYPAMQKWYDFLLRRAAKRPRHLAFPKKKGWRAVEKYVVDTGFDFGEGKEPGQAEDARLTGFEVKDIGTACLARDGLLLGKIAQILAEHQPDKGPAYKRLINESVRYSETGEKAREAYCFAFTEDGRISSDRQCLYVRPLAFGLLPEDRRQEAADALNALVAEDGYRLNTGDLTTPDLCRVLAEYGHADTAYRLLFQEAAPGWMYEVKLGATAVWADWEAVDAEGNPLAPMSACGSAAAIASFLLEDIAGIRYTHGKLLLQPLVAPVRPEGVAGDAAAAPARPEEAAAEEKAGEAAASAAGDAEKQVSNEPAASKTGTPAGMLPAQKHYLESASATLKSPEGEIVCGWKYESDGRVTVSGALPEGLAVEVVLPDGSTKKDVKGKFSFLCKK